MCNQFLRSAVVLVGLAWGPLSSWGGYLVDGSGNVVTGAQGTCWRTAEWSARTFHPKCDSQQAAKAEAMSPPVAERPVQSAMKPEPMKAPEVASRAVPVKPADMAAPPAAKVVVPMNLSVDVLFGFDQFDIHPRAFQVLDQLAEKLRNMQLDQVLVTGHADRFGSAQYNQKISEQRAQAVKDYLVKKYFPSEKVVAVGKGESEPVTASGQCPGVKSAKAIACLQADRRVQIDLVGAQSPSTNKQ